MSDSLDLRFLMMLIAAPGLGIIGRSGFTLMAWVYKRSSSPPGATDELLLALVSADITLASLPLIASFIVGLYAPSNAIAISTATLALGLTIAYSLLYFFFRSRLAALRLSIRKRRTQQAGA